MASSGSAVAFSAVSGHLLADLATLQTDINALSSLPAINAAAHYAQQREDYKGTNVPPSSAEMETNPVDDELWLMKLNFN